MASRLKVSAKGGTIAGSAKSWQIGPIASDLQPTETSMKQTNARLLLLAAIASAVASNSRSEDSRQDSVLGYHGGSDRRGNFVVPGLTSEKAKSLRADQNFHARVAGNVYAQPLFWRGGRSNSGVLLVATEDNNVQALDAATGEQIWMRSLGRPVGRSALRCGNINPLGVTGTPVIDAASEALSQCSRRRVIRSASPDFRIVT